MARGRKSKLSEQQWNEIRKRLLAGEKTRDIAREFSMAESTIRERFSDEISKIKTVANQIVTTEKVLHSLPISAQIATLALADDLRSISSHLSSAARFGAATAHRLSGIAHAQVAKVDDADPMESQETLQAIAALTKMSNDASKLGLDLIVASKKDPLPDESEKQKLIGFRVVAS